MKTVVLAVLAALVGVSVGLGKTWYDFARGSNRFEAQGLTEVQRWPVTSEKNKDQLDAVVKRVRDASDSENPGQVLIVNGEDHDFGTMDINAENSHTFVLKNIGNGPLTIAQGRTTCKCTTSDLPSGHIKPGETAEITLEWTAKEYSEDFAQTAEIVTSDPHREIVHLQVLGRVIPTIRAFPSKVVFSDLAASEQRTTLVHVLSYADELSCESYEFTNPEIAEFFDVRIFEMPAGQIMDEFDAHGGFNLWVMVKPGLPAGPIQQNLRLTTSNREGDDLEIPIEGEVVSDITFAGHADFRQRSSTLDLGYLPQGKGRTVTLRMFVKGPHRDDVSITVDPAETDPADVLQASIGEPTVVSNGKARMFSLTITIPPDSRSLNRYGSGAGKTGKILIRTTHPKISEIPLYIKFAIGG